MNKSSTSVESTSVNHHMQSDIRQLGGLMMIFGYCAIVFPAAGVASGFGQNGAEVKDPSQVPFWGLIGGLFVMANGAVAVIAGYLAAVHDYSHPYITRGMKIFIQTSWIGYITDMVGVGKGSQAPPETNPFIPAVYGPSSGDVSFVGAMGILAILTYAIAFIGSFAFLAWVLDAYNNNVPETRAGAYYRSRLNFYSFLLFIAGTAQFLMGVYIAANFSASTLDQGPITVAMLFVSIPLISVVVGAIQMVNAVWGFLRGHGYHSGPDDNKFSLSIGIQWILVVSLQIIAQVGFLPGGGAARAAPTILGISFGINAMPAFLDYKMRTVPLEFGSEYYALNSSDASNTQTEIKSVTMPEVKAAQMNASTHSVLQSSEFAV